VLLVQFDLVKSLVVEGSGSHVRRRRLVGSFLHGELGIGFSLSDSGSLPSSLCVWAFARRSSPRIESDILLLITSALDPKLRSDSIERRKLTLWIASTSWFPATLA
jgi:hypothetical protein